MWSPNAVLPAGAENSQNGFSFLPPYVMSRGTSWDKQMDYSGLPAVEQLEAMPEILRGLMRELSFRQLAQEGDIVLALLFEVIN